MLLEEAVLHLLRKAGYKTVDEIGNDPTLAPGGAGMFVKGRGGKHQIDAIADFLVYQPFTNPHRLLCEAKCHSGEVGLKDARNAVGVLKDVSEYWTPLGTSAAARRRFHYQYALFSASRFSREAQRYAFAQDIYLIPLAESTFFRPVLRAIYHAVRRFTNFELVLIPDGSLNQMRRRVRAVLRDGSRVAFRRDVDSPVLLDLGPFFEACRNLNYVLLGVLGGTFPILLAPGPAMRHGDVPEHLDVRIFWDENGWYLRDSGGQGLFSFDIPSELFDLYAEEGTLSQERAFTLKAEFMAIFQAIQTDGNRARIINFELDADWLQQIRRRSRQRPRT